MANEVATAPSFSTMLTAKLEDNTSTAMAPSLILLSKSALTWMARRLITVG